MLDYDGDELDVLVIADQAFQPGIIVPVRITGAMEMIDSNETDAQINCCNWLRSTLCARMQSFKDVPEHLLEIKDFFENYKNLQNKKVIINGFKDEVWAIKELSLSS